jgi:hypothetical protein
MCDELLHRIRYKHGLLREQVTIIEPIKEFTPTEPKCLSLGLQRHSKKKNPPILSELNSVHSFRPHSNTMCFNIILKFLVHI